MFVGRRILCLIFALGCAGCCTVNACISDLAFASLTRPDPSELQDVNPRGDLRRVQFNPGSLKLRFSTTKDVFHLQEHSDGDGSRLAITLCDDKRGIVGFGGVYTEDGWTADPELYDNDYNKRVATVKYPQHPPMPILRRATDGRITYEAAVRIESVMHDVGDPNSGRRSTTFAPLPSDSQKVPDLCFQIGGGVFPGYWESNWVVLRREALANVLVRP